MQGIDDAESAFEAHLHRLTAFTKSEGKFPLVLEEALVQLENKGCHRKLLLLLVARVFTFSSQEIETTPQCAWGFTITERQLRPTIKKLRAVANIVRELNESAAFSVLEYLASFDEIENGRKLVKEYSELPHLLESYGRFLEWSLSISKRSPFSGNRFRSIAKWTLVTYVRQTTSKPNYTLVSELLYAAAEFLNVMPDLEQSDEFDYDALRKSFDRVPDILKQSGGIADPLAMFLAEPRSILRLLLQLADPKTIGGSG
jgi:hypothetical protein